MPRCLATILMVFLVIGCESTDSVVGDKTALDIPSWIGDDCKGKVDCWERPNTTGFDLTTARALIERCAVTDGENAAALGGSDCWDKVKTLRTEAGYRCPDGPWTPLWEGTELRVFRDLNNEDMVVAFKGTGDEYGVAADVQAQRADWEFRNGTVIENSIHQGFKCAYVSIKDALEGVLEAEISNIQDPSNARVYFTGHSMGGGMAIVAALDLVKWLMDRGYRRRNVVMYSFAAPRTMTKILYPYYRDQVPNSWEVAGKWDAVTHALEHTPDYTHTHQMAVLTSRRSLTWNELEPGTRIDLRVDNNDPSPRYYDDCFDPLHPRQPDMDPDHILCVYYNRLMDVRDPGLPNLSIDVASNKVAMIWKGGVQGPCDKVMLFKGEPATGNVLESVYAMSDWDGIELTSEDKQLNLHIAYQNSVGKIIKSHEYVPRAPDVFKFYPKRGFLRLEWERVSDIGVHDFVAVYAGDSEPTGKEVFDFIRADNAFNELNNLYQTNLSGTTRDFWAAYVASEVPADNDETRTNRARILKIVKHNVRAVWSEKGDEPSAKDIHVYWKDLNENFGNEYVGLFRNRPSRRPDSLIKRDWIHNNPLNYWDTNENWTAGINNTWWVALMRDVIGDDHVLFERQVQAE